ncbi:nuclear transport factor 2 family protein [Streptosporangium sp. NPDC002721]|uniref:nuclear transport factor 2 family protein n=1 Tax=Streptosporangium sp. NPDC002721 TaxID=3366188 RepID=UPI003687FB2A
MSHASTVPSAVRRYFELAVLPDQDPYFALFADDATVEDEGVEHHGVAAIRAWRTAVPDVVYTVTGADLTGDATDATADVSGDFPGSPVTLRFHFEYGADGRISVLRIRP